MRIARLRRAKAEFPRKLGGLWGYPALGGGTGTPDHVTIELKEREPITLAHRQPKAFWSYTRFDDEHARGTLTALRKRLEDELRAQRGTPFAIYQDRSEEHTSELQS